MTTNELTLFIIAGVEFVLLAVIGGLYFHLYRKWQEYEDDCNKAINHNIENLERWVNEFRIKVLTTVENILKALQDDDDDDAEEEKGEE